MECFVECAAMEPSSEVTGDQSDLEVILEFLEEYYRQSAAEDAPPHDLRVEQGHEPEQMWPCLQSPVCQSPDCPPALHRSAPERGPPLGRVPHEQRVVAAAGGRRLRLFHFLFEMLETPAMAHCLSWVPAASGVFRFSSANKDVVAALWGQRKGNKRPMTYQKMSRALRNYARSGEIVKVKKKLTYQFSQHTLMSLQRSNNVSL